MSEHTLQRCHERHNESQESLHQSVWMAQRTRTSWNSSSVVSSSFARHDRKEENHERMVVQIVEPSKGTLLDADICAGNLPDTWMCQQGDFDAASDFVNSAKTNRVHTTDEGAEIINEALLNSRNLSNARSERCLLGQRVGTSEPDFTSRLPALGPTKQIFSSKDTWNQTGSISQNLAEWPLKSFTHLIEESDPDSSRITFKEQSIETNFISSEQDCCNSANCSTYLVCDKKKDKQPLARNSERIYGSLYSRQKDGALRINDFSTSKIYIPTSVENSTREFSLTRLFPCHCSHTGDTKLEELNQRGHLLHRMPTCSVYDVETPTMCTTMGSMEGVHGAPLVSSQTTQQYLNTNNTDVDLSKGKHLTRVSVLSTNSKRDAIHKLHSLPSSSDSHYRWVPKLQDLGKSTGKKGEEDTGNVENSSLSLMNKSLAGTDIMDIAISPARTA